MNIRNNRNLNQGVKHFWSKLGDCSLNRWQVIYFLYSFSSHLHYSAQLYSLPSICYFSSTASSYVILKILKTEGPISDASFNPGCHIICWVYVCWTEYNHECIHGNKLIWLDLEKLGIDAQRDGPTYVRTYGRTDAHTHEQTVAGNATIAWGPNRPRVKIISWPTATTTAAETTRTTRTPAFWGYPPPLHDYSYYWPVHFESQVHTIDLFISDPKSKEGESRKIIKI